MDIGAIEFFEENKYAYKLMLERGLEYGLTSMLVQAGMERVHERVKGGEEIKRIMLAREAFAEARKIDEAEFVERMKTLARTDVRFRELEARLARIEDASIGFKRRRRWFGRRDF